MNKRTFYLLFLSALVTHSVHAQQEQASPIPYEVTLDHSKQFWIDSEQVEDQFLIKVYLPERYFTSPSSVYPVIYLTDGDRYFGMASDLVYSQLYRDDVDVILVGIAYGSRALNDEKRGRDFNDQSAEKGSVGSDKYLAFLKDELFPTLERDYRIDASNRTLVGWSRGAVFTLNVLFEQPELFRNYIALSPRLNYPRWSALELEEEYHQRRKDLPANLYFSMGSDDERYSLFPAFAQTLERRGYEGFTLTWDVFEGFEHDVFALSQGMASGFEHLLYREGIDQLLLPLIHDKGIQHAISEYHRLLEVDPYGYNFGESTLNELGYDLLSLQKNEEALEIFKLNVERYPTSFNVYDSLGEAYMISGQKELAVKNYKKSLALNPANTNAEEKIEQLTMK